MAFVDQHLTPTAITPTNPVKVTVADHGLTPGNRLRATKFTVDPVITGMEQLNNRDFVIQNTTTNTFDLHDDFGTPIDGTAYTAFISGGQLTITGPELDYENSI